VAAGALLISEAGGRVTNFKDEPLDIYNEQFLATNGLLHEPMMTLLT